MQLYLNYFKEDRNYLPYIFGGFILGSIIFEIFNRYVWLAIFIASCFFTLIYFYRNILFLIITFLFFIIALGNNVNYYNYVPNSIEEVRVTKVNYYGGKGKINGRNVYLNGNMKDVKMGDRLLVSGEFIENKQRNTGILGTYKIDNIKILRQDYKTNLYRLREKIFYRIKEKLGWRRASLVTSISFGYTEFLDEEDKSDMKNFGLMHLVAVSGLHMALIYGIINKLFSYKISPFIALGYLLFTGASVSTIRAYIMILCMDLSLPLKRNYNPIAGISLAGIIILLMRPYSIFEIGFQLSFLATIGIILFNKNLNKKLYKLPKYLREGISICLSAQVFVFPTLVIYFKEFSIGFILANLIISPLISILIILGNLLAITIFIPAIFNYLCFLTHYVTRGIDIVFEVLEGTACSLVYFNENIALMYLVVLISFYFCKNGYRQFIYMPIMAFIYICVVIYSPFPTIQYYRDGAILVSYKGEKVPIMLKSDINIEKLKKITLTKGMYREIRRIAIGDKVSLESMGKNFILKNRGKEYLLVLSRDKTYKEYDIINFRENNFDKIILLLDDVIILD